MGILKFTNMRTGEVIEPETDFDLMIGDWITKFRPRPERQPVPVPAPMTPGEWDEVERLREINHYRYQDETYGTEPLDDCEESEDECDTQD
jgi:hypothetical protein